MLAIIIILCAALFVIVSLYFGELFMGLEELTRRSKQMVDLLREHGWEVTCRRIVTEEL